MPTFNDAESGSSVRTKINTAITTVDGLGSGDNLLMTAAERSKLTGVEASATADQTGSEIKAAYEGEADTNAFDDAAQTKLAGIASGATANTGALADLDTVDTAQIDDDAITIAKLAATGTASGTTFYRGDGVWATPAGGGGGISNVVDDATPQLGGDLDANGNAIDMGTNNITDTAVGQWITAYGWGDHSSAGYASNRGDLSLDTSDSPQFAAINLGHASDTTITRVSAGVIAVEGVTVLTEGSGTTLSDTAIATGDSIPFFDDSDSDDAKQRTVSGVISDLGLLVSGGALGTPSSGVATNLTGTATGLTAGNVTTNADLTGDVTSSGNATTIATDAVDIPMLSATGTASASTFLRGDNTWATPGGSGDMTAATYDAATIAEQLVGLTATQTLTNKTLTYSVNAQTGTTYTLVLTDAHKKVTMSNAAANTLTIPTNASVAFPVGTVLGITMLGAGATTVEGDTGVTVNGVSAGGAAISAQYTGVTLTKLATNTWLMEGNHGAVA